MILSIEELSRQGLTVPDACDPQRFGYPGGLDIFDCLWFEIVNVARMGVDWRCDRDSRDLRRVSREMRSA